MRILALVLPLVMLSAVHRPHRVKRVVRLAQAEKAAVVQDAGVRISVEPAAASSVDAGNLAGALKPEETTDEAEDESNDTSTGDMEAPLDVPNRLTQPPLLSVKSLPVEVDLLAKARRDAKGRLWVRQGAKEEPLTIDSALQEKLTAILRSYQTPYAAVVAIEPSTGRVLAMAEHSEARPGLRGLTTKAIYPAASIFKIVTASALLEKGITPDSTACFHGGKRRLSESLLSDSPRDRDCYTLATALAKSANVVFAKMTFKHLTQAKLSAMARAYYFNRAFPFPVPTDISLASFPDDRMGFASTGAGFGDVYLSPLHGALLASVAANGGVFKPPKLFASEVRDEPGERVMSEAHSKLLVDMLEGTVTGGTARRVFRERGHRVKGAVGKTGSLADKNPFHDYSWFVGFAPRDKPKIAVAAVIVNDMRWRIRGTWLGREAMRLYLDGGN